MKDSSYKAIKENDIDLMSMGFFLSTRDTYVHVLQDLEHGEIHCVLGSKLIKPLLAFKDLEKSLPFNKTFKELKANQFTLVFSNCICDIVVSMDINTIIYNLEEDGDGTRDYLSAGETLLGALYVQLFYCIFYFNAFLKLGDKIHRVLYNATVCLFKTMPIAKLIEALVAKFQTSRTTSQWFIQFTSLHFISCSLYVQPFFLCFLFQCIFIC